MHQHRASTRNLRLRRTCIQALAVSCALLAHSANANLLLNGSFESPLVPPGGLTNFLGGSNLIDGWQVVGVDSAVTSSTFSQSGITFQAQDGQQWLDLTGFTSNSQSSGVTQTVSTVIGVPYKLDFFVGSATDGVLFYPATIDLGINGGNRIGFFNATAPNSALDWKPFSTSFYATSATTEITFYNGSSSNNYLAALDNVSLYAVPEPSEAIIALLGLVGIFCTRLRSSNRVHHDDA